MRILSARYGNQARTSAVMMTDERGAVAVSEIDRPELWGELMKWVDGGGVIADPAPDIVLTQGDIAASQLQKLPALRGLVVLLAERFGMTQEQVIQAIKEKAE